MLHDGVRPWDPDAEPFIENMGHHSAVIARLIKAASEMTEMVAPTFQLGVQTIHECGISSIVGPDGEHTWSWERDGEPSPSS